MTFVYVSVLIISVAFALVSIYIAKILSRTSGLIGTLRETMLAVEAQVDHSINELEETIEAADVTATDVENKLAAVNGLFASIQNIGEATGTVGETIHTRTKMFVDAQSLPGTKPFIRAIQLAEFGHGLFRSWKKGRQASS